jgi:hypothetical protein
VTVDKLIEGINSFVSAASDGGRRAQAVVAGLMDVLAGPERVRMRKINDPSRRVPGDVAVASKANDKDWERILEVRDKQITREDLITLADRAASSDIGEVTMVAIAAGQSDIPIGEVRKWAAQRGVSLWLVREWDTFVRQLLHWGPTPTLVSAKQVPARVLKRLIQLEVSESTVSDWEAFFHSTRQDDCRET